MNSSRTTVKGPMRGSDLRMLVMITFRLLHDRMSLNTRMRRNVRSADTPVASPLPSWTLSSTRLMATSRPSKTLKRSAQ